VQSIIDVSLQAQFTQIQRQMQLALGAIGSAAPILGEFQKSLLTSAKTGIL
jgi:hypothetical protein